MENILLLTDEELVKMAQEGSDTATEILIEKYKGFVKLKAKPYFIAGQETEDVVQEGMIGLFKAIIGFDNTRDVLFKTFAEKCINSQILNAIKKANTQKNRPLNESVSLSSEIDSDGDINLEDVLFASSSDEPETSFLSKEALRSIAEDVDGVFSDFEKQVLNLKVKGLSYKEISKVLSKTPKTIDNATQRIKKKVMKYLEK